MKTLKKWMICLSLVMALSMTAVGCGNMSNGNEADETKTTADKNGDNLGDDIEEGMDDAGDAVDDTIDVSKTEWKI